MSVGYFCCLVVYEDVFCLLEAGGIISTRRSKWSDHALRFIIASNLGNPSEGILKDLFFKKNSWYNPLLWVTVCAAAFVDDGQPEWRSLI